MCAATPSPAAPFTPPAAPPTGGPANEPGVGPRPGGQAFGAAPPGVGSPDVPG
ncbi:hypothetical protein MAHJHV45_48440 [Mycobacterium avium subsp. hominissuis]